jgi:hypothetical protein
MNPTTSNRLNSNNDSLPVEVTDLVRAISKLPEENRAELEGAVERIVEFTHRRRRILNMVQDALGQLRLDMKYLMFDLEATRRERDQYRKDLDENQF